MKSCSSKSRKELKREICFNQDMKCAVIDIDGVLNYYPSTYISFVNDTLGTSFKTLSEMKLEIPFTQYEDLKKAYRKSSYKHDAKPRDGACEFLHFLQRHDYLIYIVTSRDLFKYNQLEKTILWLQKNDLHYDYLYRSDKKDFVIYEKFKHVDLVIEDSVDNLERIKSINGEARYYNMKNADNESILCSCTRVNGFDEILADLCSKEA